MHLVDHGRSHIEKTYKRPFRDRIVRSFLSKVLSNSFNFRIIAILTRFTKPFSFLFPKKISEMIRFMPNRFPQKTLSTMKIYLAQNKKKPKVQIAGLFQ